MTLAVSIAQGGSNNVTFRNRIINGAMVISQRGTSPTIGGGGDYSVDRFYNYYNGNAYTSVQSTTAPAGYINSLLLTTTSPSSTAAYSFFGQKIEGLNITDLAWGSASAQPVTLSFWVRSSVTGVYSFSLSNSAADRAYAAQYTINSANTWEQKTTTIPGDTSGTWLTTNGTGINIRWNMGTYTAGRLISAGSWQAVNADGATGSTGANTWANTNGATFYITGVQLEAGTTASPFEYRQIGQELNLCQRYYQKTFNQSTAPANNVGVSYLQISLLNGQDPQITFPLPVIMRSAPTVTLYNPFFSSPAGQWSNGSSSSSNARSLNLSDSTMQIDNTDVTLSGWGNAGINYAASAEL